MIETTNELSSVKTGEVLFQELPEEPIVLSTSNPIDSNTPVEEISRIVGEFLKGIGIKGAAANGSVLNKEQFCSVIIISLIGCFAEWKGRMQSKASGSICSHVSTRNI